MKSHPVLLNWAGHEWNELLFIIHRKIWSPSCQFFSLCGPFTCMKFFSRTVPMLRMWGSICNGQMEMLSKNILKSIFSWPFRTLHNQEGRRWVGPINSSSVFSTEASLPKPYNQTIKFPALSANQPFYRGKQIVLFKIRLKFGYVSAINTACDFNTKHINLIINLFWLGIRSQYA